MGENVTIKEYMKLNGYKTEDANFDLANLNPECLFVGDVYVVKYKEKYDIRAPFEEQTTLKLKKKNAILLRIGFEKYINLSNIRTLGDVERIRRKLRSKLKSSNITILGNFFKPFVGDQVVLEVKPYEQENKNKQETPKTKRIEKRFFK